MPISVEVFSVGINGTPEPVHAWTSELFRSAMQSVNQIWQSQANITFDVSARFTEVTMLAGDFPGGDNWSTELLSDRPGAPRYSMLSEQALYFAVSTVNRTHTSRPPQLVRIILLPCRSRSVTWAGRAVNRECYCPRPLGEGGDGLADIMIAHELGHILLGPGHHPLARNLMFFEQSNIMRPPQLDDSQRERLALSPLVSSVQQTTTGRSARRTNREIDPHVRGRGLLDPTRTVAAEGMQGSRELLGKGRLRRPLGSRRDLG
jgi:hypothetical protein